MNEVKLGKKRRFRTAMMLFPVWLPLIWCVLAQLGVLSWLSELK